MFEAMRGPLAEKPGGGVLLSPPGSFALLCGLDKNPLHPCNKIYPYGSHPVAHNGIPMGACSILLFICLGSSGRIERRGMAESWRYSICGI